MNLKDKAKKFPSSDECYRWSELKAERYFTLLYEQVMKKTYVDALLKDIQSWKQNHIHRSSLLALFLRGKGKPVSKEYYTYIQWLNYTGKLDHYLDRSISYIYLRDLGKDLDSSEIQSSVQRMVDSLKSYLIQNQSNETDRKYQTETFSMAGIYRIAQKKGIESTMIWLVNKLKNVADHIPNGMNAEHAQRKLIKIIAGVILHVVEEMDDEMSSEDRSQKLDTAIRLGYSYGLTYPFIDDLLDSDVLSDKEKTQYSEMIRTTLITGYVPDLAEWTGNNVELINYIHSELRDAYEYIKNNQHPETIQSFFEQSYVFFNSQELDREKELSNPNYTNEELYIPIILKSSSSRLIVRSVISAPFDEGFDKRSFFYGIYNQLADDFADMFEDMKDNAVTPYTYYLKYHDKRPDLINPFELYWAVISNLIHNVYHSDSKTCEVILDRAINGLKRFKERMGSKKYYEVMELFAAGNPAFNRIIQQLVKKADDVDFFDKLIRDHMISVLRNNRKEQEDFKNTIETIQNQINEVLEIEKTDEGDLLEDPITDAANFMLAGGGKRLRPIMTWVMGVNGYGLGYSAILPLLRSLEYMHTASLIFDDLPSQDNASIRRGRPTLHKVYNIAIGELTGLFLTQKAVEELATLDQFDSKKVLCLIQYSARITQDMCKGQAMDLDSKGKRLTLEELNKLCFYKTGLGFEASLLMPAILAKADEAEMKTLKIFAKHAGIAFQIKDDLLDVEGDLHLLGKPVGKDAENDNSTFVSILGVDGAKKEMWEHYCLAMEALQKVPRNTVFLKQLLNYVVNRER